MNFKNNLLTPIPYLIQKNFDFKALDEEGWSLGHYAVAAGNIKKLTEYLFFDIELNNLSQNNKIPDNLLQSYGKEDIGQTISVSIPFTEKGITPFHLNIYLIHYYKNKSHVEYQKNLTVQEEIFEAILQKDQDAIFWVDSDSLTPTDYCILSCNSKLIQHIIKIDPDMSSVIGLTSKTAQSIFEMHLYQLKKTSGIPKQNDIEFINYLIDFFKAKNSKENLEKKLTCKNDKNTDIIKI